MSDFKEIDIQDFCLNPFEIKSKWMLISAEKEGVTNTMTASWGGFGVMWNKEVVFIVIRPQRYTKEFIDAVESFSLTFFDESYKEDLSYLGRVSGREEKKIENTKLTLQSENQIPYFKEAKIAIFSKKLYVQPMDPECFLDKKTEEHWYPKNDHHILYIAEVSKVLIKE